MIEELKADSKKWEQNRNGSSGAPKGSKAVKKGSRGRGR